MKKILVQLDTDRQASVFDRVVALDAGADEVFSYGHVQAEQVEALIHGAIFTRGPKDLKSTAIFVGGQDVEAGEKVIEKVRRSFFGPLRVSVMSDCNGSNTTAAAAVIAAGRHVPLETARVVVFGGTGPVGRRIGELVAAAGGTVRVTSRTAERAEETCELLRGVVPNGKFEAHETCTPAGKRAVLEGVGAIFAAGAAGAQFLAPREWERLDGLGAVVDLNAVPPAGLAGVDPQDAGEDRGGVRCYGAFGVGAMKMRIHRAAVARLFESNDALLDTRAIYALGRQLLDA